MTSLPKISVVTPCFNQGKYLSEMIESLDMQTFQEFEVIIVNDGSTDNTRDIMDKIKHEKITIIHTDNYGPSHARNVAIDKARAPIILNLDADDKIAPSLLEKAYDVFQSGSPDVGIVYCDAELFGARSGKYDIEEYTLERMLWDNRIISQGFFSKEDWHLVGGYSEELIYGAEDWDFWLSLIELGRNVVKIPERLVFYRQYHNPDNCRSGRFKKDRQKFLKTLLCIFHRHEKLYQSCPAVWKHFTQLDHKTEHDNFIIRKLKDYHYKYSRIIRLK